MEDFRKNLRFLCGMYKSVAEVCRRIEINRQQFNKYLGGQADPSRYNLRKICNFFGVDEEEILGPHDVFTALFDRPEAAEISGVLPPPIGDFFPPTSDALRKYVGYYFSYVISPSIPNHIIKSITHLGLQGDRMVTKTYERIVIKDSDDDHYSLNKYKGFCYESADLIYLVEHEYLSNRGYIFTALYPSYRSRIQYLNGMVLGVSGASLRRPFASQISFEYLGESADLRQSLAACGCYPFEAAEIPDEIRKRVLVPPSADEFNMLPPIF